MGPNYASYHCKPLDMKAKHLEGKNKSEVYQYSVKWVQSSLTVISLSCYTENVEVRDDISHGREKQRNTTKQ